MIFMWLEKPANQNKTAVNNVIIISIGIILALLASARPEDMPDYSAYYRIYTHPQNQINERIELGFIWFILSVKQFIADDFIIFLFSAGCAAVLIKLFAIRQLSKLFFSSLYIYIASKYISNDLIQMRVAFSTGLMLFAVYYKYNEQLLKFLIVTTLAFLFHYSAILLYLIWLLPTKTINKSVYVLLVIGSYVLALIGFSLAHLITYVPISGIQNLYVHYTEVVESSGANLFSILLISKLLICLYFLITWEKYAVYSPYFIILIKLFAISLIAYCLLFSINAVAVRIAELFQIVEIILIPFLYYFSKNRIVGKTMITVIGLIYFVFYVNFSGWFS